MSGPAWPTVYRRFARWSRDRAWARLHRAIFDEPGARGELDRRHWAVERTVPWPAGCRRPHRRYERKAEHFLAFVGMAATLIACRRLTDQTSV